MRYYCTYFDKGYLVRAVALHESLCRNEQQPFTLIAVCLDEITRIILDKLALPGLVTVPLHRLEACDAELREARHNRSQREYYWTLTPTVVLRILEWYPALDFLTYLDADLYFFSSPQPIFDEFAGHSVLIHEHRFHEVFMPAMKYGRYNVGLLCFRRDANAMKVLNWWRDRCNEWCYDHYEDGKFGDQLYLENWPDQFQGVHVLEHIGAGVAPWNCMQYEVDRDDTGTVIVNGVPLIFYHFHALVIIHPNYIVLSKLLAHKFSLELLQYSYLPYSHALHGAVQAVRGILPDFCFGLYSEGCHLCSALIRGARELTVVEENGTTAPATTIRLDNEYTLFVTEQVSGIDV